MKYKKINDYEAIYMIRDNADEDSWYVLLEKYRPIMFALSKKYLLTAKKHGLEFEDLLQECYICFYKTIKTFNEKYNVLFYTYVCFCMNRHLQTICRNINNKKSYILDNSDFDFRLDSLEDKNANIMSMCLTNDLSKNFLEFLNSFDILDSSIFELRFNGFSYDEISKLLDIPLKYVHSKLYLLRRNIKEKFKKEY